MPETVEALGPDLVRRIGDGDQITGAGRVVGIGRRACGDHGAVGGEQGRRHWLEVAGGVVRVGRRHTIGVGRRQRLVECVVAGPGGVAQGIGTRHHVAVAVVGRGSHMVVGVGDLGDAERVGITDDAPGGGGRGAVAAGDSGADQVRVRLHGDVALGVGDLGRAGDGRVVDKDGAVELVGLGGHPAAGVINVGRQRRVGHAGLPGPTHGGQVVGAVVAEVPGPAADVGVVGEISGPVIGEAHGAGRG